MNMNKSKGRQQYKMSDGTSFDFNYPAFKSIYGDAGNVRGRKTAIRDRIADTLNVSVETVKGWINGKHAPSDLQQVEKLEKLMGVEAGSFLIEQAEKKDGTGGKMMREISEIERNTARELYVRMCEEIDNAKYVDNELYGALYTEGRGAPPRDNEWSMGTKERNREKMILMVRKAGFDIPTAVRDELINLINRLYGPWNVNTNDMFFKAEEYRTYLQKSSLSDCVEVRYVYSDLFIAEQYRKLDEIFNEYRCTED